MSGRIDSALVYSFFMEFSRAEYALKRAGFVRGNEKKVEADWTRFARSVAARWETLTSDDFRGARDFLDKQGPKKQVLRDGDLDWEDSPDPSKCQAERVCVYFRRVRNNLFHGGKWGAGPVEPPERDSDLLRNSLVVLRGMLGLDDRVQSYFVASDDQQDERSTDRTPNPQTKR